MTDDANSIIESVQDLVTVTKIDESDLVDEVNKGKEKAQEVVEELNILDDYQASRLQEMKQEIQMLRSFISELDGMFKSGDLSVRNYSQEAIKDLPSYQAVMDTINNKNPETISAMYGDNIDDMPMYEIEKMKDELSTKLDKNGQEFLNTVYTDLENGEIDRAEYSNILKVKLANSINEGTMSEGFLFDLLTYLDENKVDIAKGAGKDAIVSALEQSGLATIGQSGKIIISEGIKGPEGENSFILPNEETTEKANKYKSGGKWLGRIGKGVGGIFTGAGLLMGYKEDREENNKTMGEAVTHNAASFGAGVATSLAVTAAFSNPVGVVAVGVAAIGVAAGTVMSVAFDVAYDANLFGIQDGLDWAGNKIDEGWENAKVIANDAAENVSDAWEGTKDIANNVGEAVSDELDAINPMNWAW